MHVTVIIQCRQSDGFAAIASSVYQRDPGAVRRAVSRRERIGMVLCLPGNRIPQALHSHLVLVRRAQKINAIELRIGSGLEIKTLVSGPARLRLDADRHDAQLVYTVALLDRVEFKRVRTRSELDVIWGDEPLISVPASCAGYRDRTGQVAVVYFDPVLRRSRILCRGNC